MYELLLCFAICSAISSLACTIFHPNPTLSFSLFFFFSFSILASLPYLTYFLRLSARNRIFCVFYRPSNEYTPGITMFISFCCGSRAKRQKKKREWEKKCTKTSAEIMKTGGKRISQQRPENIDKFLMPCD